MSWPHIVVLLDVSASGLYKVLSSNLQSVLQISPGRLVLLGPVLVGTRAMSSADGLRSTRLRGVAHVRCLGID